MASYDHAGGHPDSVGAVAQGYFTVADDRHGEAGFDGSCDYEDVPGSQDADPGDRSFAKTVNMLGAVASLALVVGIGVWGFKLVVRDVSGVPVVRALEGPMRLQPKDPGGRPADHQGLAVNAVAASGAAEPAADRVKLAPRPVGLSDEDLPMGELAADDAEPETVQSADPAPARTDTEAGDASAAAVVAFQPGQADVLVAELTAKAEPGDAQVPEAQVQRVAAARIVQPEAIKPVVAATVPDPGAEVPAIVTGPGVARSLRPQPRPARAVPGESAPVAERAVAKSAAASDVLDVDPGSLPAGTRLAQLGAYESVEVAQAEWDRIQGRFADYLEGKQRVIQKASSGGRTFYRLRALGFDDLSDARRFCSALVAQSADCIPVTTR